jgi:glycosyltransferase involved in cell wall biosynthesis
MVVLGDREGDRPLSIVRTKAPSFAPRTDRMECRLLYLVGQLHTGGLERQLCYLLRAMDRERYKPAVVAWTYCEGDIHVPPIRALGVPFYYFPRTLSAAAKLRAFRRLVRELRPEVVHSYSFYTNFAAYWGARGIHIIALGSVRNDFTLDKESAGSWLGRLSARWPHNQICNSSAAAETARRSQSHFVPRRLYVVRNGLDLERFRSFPMATERPVCILGVGYLLPYKRWDRLLTAALELKQRGFDCLIRIAGDGPLRQDLEKQAQDLGVAGRVEFIGHTDDIPSLLADATFLVHTSDNEGCPNAVMEAMACGRAVVATDAGDVPSLVEDGKTGFIVHRGDTTTLVERIMRLITDRELCRCMGEAGRAKAEGEFAMDRLVEETLAVYRQAGWQDA